MSSVGHDVRNLLTVLTLHEDPEVVAAAWEIDALIRALEVDAVAHVALVARLGDIEGRQSDVDANRCTWRFGAARCCMQAGHSVVHDPFPAGV